MKDKKIIKSENQFPVVGIGASAGGLDAFKKLLKAIPEIYEKLIFKPTHNVNLVCNIDNLYKNTVDLSIGVYNLLNTKLSYLYPFDAGYQPLYGMGTELMVHLKLKF